MKQIITLSQYPQDPRKAVVPDKGTAAFFRSTGKRRLSYQRQHSGISLHFPTCRGSFNDFLPNRHYFRRRLAKHPLVTVVMIEGQAKPLETREEAAA